MKREHTGIFYGWYIVGACFFISLYTGGAISHGFTAIFEPIADEFGWSYAQISLAASLRGLETGLLAPVGGWLVDRWGPRRLILGGTLITGIGLIVLSRTTSLGMFYAAFILIALGMSASSQTVLLTAIAHWFRRKIGTATGVAVSGFATGGLLVPVVAILIDAFQWRAAMVILGIGTWVVAIPLSLLIRHTPEAYGYLPDGEAVSTDSVDESPPPAPTTADDAQASQALRSRTFWHLSLAFMLQAMVIGAVTTHVMPYLSTIGIGRATASFMASAIPVTSICGRLSFGWIGDRMGGRRAAAIACSLTSVGVLLLACVSGDWTWLLLPVIALSGIGWGGGVVTRVGLLRQNFGRSRFGTIHGLAIGVLMVGSMTGPLLAGWVFDQWGSYDTAWLCLIGVGVTAVILVSTAPRYRA